MQKPPNILIIQTDQQRWDVGEPGHVCRTPHLDRLAAEGLRFCHVFPPMAHCCPSRASMMTGVLPSRHGVWNNVLNASRFSSGLAPGIETWSECLAERGYALSYNGKWHVSADEGPSDRGWDEGYVTANKSREIKGSMGKGPNYWLENDPVDTPFAERKSGQIVKPGWGDWWMYGTREERVPGYQTNTQIPWDDGQGDAPILRQALADLEVALAGKKPWCHYVGFNGPHDPYIIPRHYREMYSADELDLPASWQDSLDGKPEYFARQKARFDQMSSEEKREALAFYYGYCTMIDDMLGELLDRLEQAGELDNTVVVFCSDHGDLLGDHGLYLKGIAPYDGGYRVPLVIRAPGLICDPGREVSALVSLMDLSPTITELAGARTANTGCMDGRSLLPFFQTSKTDAPWRQALYFQCNGTEVYFSSRTVRTDRWKFVANLVAFDELYDLKNDPDERRNLAGDPRYTGIKRELCATLWQLAHTSEDRGIFSEYHTVSLLDWGPKVGLPVAPSDSVVCRPGEDA